MLVSNIYGILRVHIFSAVVLGQFHTQVVPDTRSINAIYEAAKLEHGALVVASGGDGM